MALMKQVVPWFNKQEWLDVYNSTFSSNIELQKIAFQQMNIWRFRVPNLCLGIECTQALLHLFICEKKEYSDGSFVFESHDLLPLYTTAIMRFLNHLQGLCDNITLYKMAYKFNIPEWIVNLRHETAHGNNLPHITLLREAALFIFNWLDENYWQRELKAMTDVLVDQSQCIADEDVDKTDMLLELWKSVKLYKLVGHINIKEIPNRKEMWEMMKELQNITINTVHNNNNDINNQPSLKYLMKFILRSLKKKMENVGSLKIETNVIDKLLCDQCFLPSFTSHKNGFKCCFESVITILVNIWEEVIVAVQNQGLMVHLLQSLLKVAVNKSDSRSIVAALWIKFLASRLNCNDVKEKVKVAEVIDQYTVKRFSGILSSPLCSSDTVKFILNKCSSFKKTINLKPLSRVDRSNVQQFIKDSLMEPSQNTHIFISSVLDLYEPSLNPRSKSQLCKLVDIYTKTTDVFEQGTDDEADPVDEIKTVKMVLNHFPKEAFFSLNEDLCNIENKVVCEESIISDQYSWKLYSGTEDWSKHSWGKVPWKNDNKT